MHFILHNRINCILYKRNKGTEDHKQAKQTEKLRAPDALFGTFLLSSLEMGLSIKISISNSLSNLYLPYCSQKMHFRSPCLCPSSLISMAELKP